MSQEQTDKQITRDALERLDPTGCAEYESVRHLVRYDWVCRFLPARRVLDCACGLGYGTAMLRQRGAEEAVGVDLSDEAIAQARERYGLAGIQYIQADALTLNADQLGSFDMIVSLETLEHFAEPQRLLDVFASLLAPEGILVLSCPNDALEQTRNPFHLWLADYDQLKSWLEQRFRQVACWVEARTQGAAVWPMDWAQRADGSQPHYTVPTRLVDTLPTADATGFLFACSMRSVPSVGAVAADSLSGSAYLRDLLRANQWLETQRSNWERATRADERQLEELRRGLTELEAGKAWLEEQRVNWMHTAEGAQSRIAAMDQELSQVRQELARLQAIMERNRTLWGRVKWTVRGDR